MNQVHVYLVIVYLNNAIKSCDMEFKGFTG